MILEYSTPLTSPSFSNLDQASRNLDMQELDYNPSKKDLTDARIHHLLAEELKPYRRVNNLIFHLYLIPLPLIFIFGFRANQLLSMLLSATS